MATTKRSSRILDEMHETVQGLHNAGVISKRRMGEFEVLSNLPVHERCRHRRSKRCVKRLA